MFYCFRRNILFIYFFEINFIFNDFLIVSLKVVAIAFKTYIINKVKINKEEQNDKKA